MATSSVLRTRFTRPSQTTSNSGALRANRGQSPVHAPRRTLETARFVTKGLFEKNDFEITEASDDLPEPEKDLWDDERFETLGQIGKFAVPIIAVGVVLVGAFASSQYNEGADTYMKSAPSDESSAFTVDAKEFDASVGGQ